MLVFIIIIIIIIVVSFFERREIIRQLVLRYLAKRSRDSDYGIKPSVSVEHACKQAIQI